MTGGRHPFLGQYKIGFSSDGKIKAVDLNLYANGGWSADVTAHVLIFAIGHADNTYHIENMKVCGKSLKTNLPSNTGMRGFGKPQGVNPSY